MPMYPYNCAYLHQVTLWMELYFSTFSFNILSSMQLSGSELENLNEIDDFLATYQLPKLTQ